MSSKNKSQLRTENSNNFPNNNSQFITPERLRDFNNDIIDSVLINEDSGSYIVTSSFDSGSRLQTFTREDGTTYTNLIPGGGGGGSTDTGSLLQTASFDNGSRNMTFTKGDASTFNVNIPDATVATGSLLVTASVVDATTTYTKGNADVFTTTINNVANAVSSSYALTASFAENVAGLESGSFLNTGSVAQTKSANINQSITAPGTGAQKNFITIDSTENNGNLYNNNSFAIQNYPGYGRAYQDTLLFEMYDSFSYLHGAEIALNGGEFHTFLNSSGSSAVGIFRLQDNYASGITTDMWSTTLNIGTGTGNYTATGGITVGTTATPVTISANEKLQISSSIDISGTLTASIDTGNVLVGDGSGKSYLVPTSSLGGGGTVAGSDTEIQYNNSGAFGAGAFLTTNKTDKVEIIHELGLVGDGGSSQGELKLYCEAGTPHYVALKGPLHAGGSSYTLQLPNTLPSVANQILESNATGTLSWIATPGAIDTGSFAIKDQANTFTAGPQIASASDGNGVFTSQPLMPTSGFGQKYLWQTNGQNLSVDGYGAYNVYQESLAHFNGYGRWYDSSWYQEFYDTGLSYGTEVTVNGGGWRTQVYSSGSGGFNGRFLVQDDWDNTTTAILDATDIEIGAATNGVLDSQRITLGRNTTEITLNGETTISGSTDISGNLTSSLQSGYVWVGDGTGRTTTAATSSFGGGGGAAFPYTGAAQITGSLGVSGSLVIQQDSYPDNRLGFKSGSTEYVQMYIDTGSEFVPDAWVINHHSAGQIFGIANSNGWIEVNTNLNMNSNSIVRGNLTTRAINQDSGYTAAFDKVTVNTTIGLTQQNPLPAGSVGELAASGSNLYFNNGTIWKQVSLV